MPSEIRVLELFSGIGGMHYALKESNINSTVIMSVDINTIANKVYQYNFPGIKNVSRNIESFTREEIEKLNINCILMSPPCQPFTRVGLKKDSCDNRCKALLHILKLIPHIKNLKYIVLENVKGFENSQAREEVINCLQQSNFNYKELILSPCQFGIPNSRHRYYLIAKKNKFKFIFNKPDLVTSLPYEVGELLPQSKYKSLIKPQIGSGVGFEQFKIQCILEEDVGATYLVPEKVITKQYSVLDISCAESRRSCCFTKAYTHYAKGTGSVLLVNSKQNVRDILDECRKSKSDNDKEKIVDKLKYRYFTPKEISRLMCFPENFEFPNDVTNKQKYRLLGNSINVHVVSQLIYLLDLDEITEE